jgi:hypothetical protein
MSEKFHSASYYASVYEVNSKTLLRLCLAGKIAHVRIGPRLIRIAESAWAEYLRTHTRIVKVRAGGAA